MSSTVFKYPIASVTLVQELTLPVGATVIAIRDNVLANSLVLYAVAKVDEKRMVVRKFFVVGAGWALPELPGPLHGYSYIGTVATNGGVMVWHAFELTGPTPIPLP